MARRARQKRREGRRDAKRRDAAGASTARPAPEAVPDGPVTGRVAARFRSEAGEGDPTCPICLRPIPAHAKQSVHHLVPKLKGGTHGPTVLVHQICHNEIHSVLTEAELARDYSTPEKLRLHPAIARFAAWVGGKDPAFHARTVGNHRKRKR